MVHDRWSKLVDDWSIVSDVPQLAVRSGTTLQLGLAKECIVGVDGQSECPGGILIDKVVGDTKKLRQ